jgi:hypothetical protein
MLQVRNANELVQKRHPNVSGLPIEGSLEEETAAIRPNRSSIGRMLLGESRLLEIETARVRHAWARGESKRNPGSPALARYVAETLKELHALTAERKPGRPKSAG